MRIQSKMSLLGSLLLENPKPERASHILVSDFLQLQQCQFLRWRYLLG